MKPQLKGDKVICMEITDISEDLPLRRYRNDVVAREAEVRIKVGGRIYTRLFCLPSHLEELAIGHLKSEGFDLSSISNLEVEEGNPEQEEYEIRVKLEKRALRKNPSKVSTEMKITISCVNLVQSRGNSSIVYPNMHP